MNCANHPGRQANNLCMSCGTWYCASCMDLSQNPPVCSNCKSARAPENHFHGPKMDYTGILNRLLNASGGLKTQIKAGLCLCFAAVLGLTILFQIKGFSFLFDINYNFLRYLPAFAALIAVIGGFVFLRTKSPKKKVMLESITPAQIEALLRADNKLTASRLAKASNTSEGYAKEVLNKMTVEGKLTVSAKDSYELVYSKNILPQGDDNERIK